MQSACVSEQLVSYVYTIRLTLSTLSVLTERRFIGSRSNNHSEQETSVRTKNNSPVLLCSLSVFSIQGVKSQ